MGQFVIVPLLLLLPVTGAALLAPARHPQAAPAASSMRLEPGGAGGGADPMGWSPRVRPRRWACIVIHHSATEHGGANRFDKTHRDKGWDGLGYHFVIGNGSDTPDGRVEAGPRWANQKHGAHCRTDDDYYNENGIGICLVGNLDDHRPTAAQRKSLQKLVKHLSREYRIPANKIYTHGGITGQTRCPGAHFDLAALRKAVR